MSESRSIKNRHAYHLYLADCLSELKRVQSPDQKRCSREVYSMIARQWKEEDEKVRQWYKAMAKKNRLEWELTLSGKDGGSPIQADDMMTDLVLPQNLDSEASSQNLSSSSNGANQDDRCLTASPVSVRQPLSSSSRPQSSALSSPNLSSWSSQLSAQSSPPTSMDFFPTSLFDAPVSTKRMYLPSQAGDLPGPTPREGLNYVPLDSKQVQYSAFVKSLYDTGIPICWGAS
ncbi:hypothetical protein BT69DRAFT_1329711 [Atractiella rhizophila]|nr:hypothetical protein BT69DRAFT_1329711 [Atractiella rhizophila]